MRLFRWKRSPADEPEPSLPWAGLPSFAAFLDTWDGSADLPDEPKQEKGGVRFAPGALDGILSHHSADEEGGKREHQVARLLDMVELAVTKSDDTSRAALYRAVQEDGALRLADDLSEAIAAQERFGPQQLRPLALWLYDHAAHRGPFKIALVLLGLCGDEEDLPRLVSAARHPEFTLYSLVAATNIAPDPSQVLRQMAGKAEGWGKIHLVERLAPLADDNREVQGWLLRDGCSGDFADMYLGWICAHHGDLRGALERGEHDDALLDGVGHLLLALCDEGPTQGMSGYSDGPVVTGLYLEALEGRCDTVWRLFVVTSLDKFLMRIGEPTQEEDFDWSKLGWTPDVVAPLRALCASITDHPGWHDRLKSELNGEKFWCAWECARYLGFDLWEQLFARLEREPLNAGLYHLLLQGQSAAHKGRVAEFARTHWDVEAMVAATSSETLMPIGDAACLDTLVWAMQGEDERFFDEMLVEAALRSPSTRTRYGAVGALEAAPRADWGPVLEATVRQRGREEPEGEICKRLKKLN